ncbi:ABC transporter ATP-binding protein [bacterium (candidate division B38) B3_B38]|nr:MAG: ABC transporter ATP-binding protein [bacterium (candidate division B38) B3_B38]
MIELIDVHKSFGNHHVLDGVNLEVKKGESMVVMGRSGSGKTVLIKHIIGLLKPDAGEVWVDGIKVNELKEKELNQLRKKFGMLFQYAALFDSLAVSENVGFALMQNTKMKRKEIEERVKECLRMVGLEGGEHLSPAELSGGMKKRVGLARAIALQPEIILYDEPSTGLDPIMADAINNLIVDLKEKLRVTSVAITHDMVSAFKIADRIAMLYKGKIIETGSPEEIKSSSNPVVQQFIHGEAEGPIPTLE